MIGLTRVPGTIALFTILTALLPTMAAAHHILGIPHYRYGDEYPQIPYLEVMAQVGDYDLDFTYFPGVPRPGERVRFKLYVRQRHTGEAFREPLTAEVVRTRFLRSPVRVAEPFTIETGSGPEANDYKFFFAFDEPEAYQVRLIFPNGESIETIPFPVVIGQTNDRPLIFGAAGVLLLAVVTVGVIKNRRRAAARFVPRRRAAR